MKATELMIGDWVECVDSTHKKKVYAKVCAIEEGQTCILMEKDNCNWFLDISLLKPIPLEKIHLVKNGFKVREYSDETEFYYYDCYEINVSFDEGISEENIPPIIYLTIELAEKSIAMPIEYVHELQQAMRIMGCDKEIEL
jgi:hypothetical protein